MHKNKLGDLGEKIAINILSRPQNGFVKVKNLNVEHPNHPYVDLYAEREGKRYVISVKTRRKYGANGELNSSYNLIEKSKGVSGNEFELVKAWADKYNAIAAWVVITGEASVFSVYFGLFAGIQEAGRYSIPMKSADLAGYECLAENEPHQYPDFNSGEPDNLEPMAKPSKNDTSLDPFASEYPSIARWVEEGGYVEIGQTSYELPAFVKALDEGGMIWEGETEYPTLDAALRDMDAGIAEWLGQNK